MSFFFFFNILLDFLGLRRFSLFYVFILSSFPFTLFYKMGSAPNITEMHTQYKDVYYYESSL